MHTQHTYRKHKCQIGAQRQTLPLEISDLLLQGGGGVFMRGKMHPRHEYALVLIALQRGHQGPLDRLLPPIGQEEEKPEQMVRPGVIVRVVKRRRIHRAGRKTARPKPCL